MCLSICSSVGWSSFLALTSGSLNLRCSCVSMFPFASGVGCVCLSSVSHRDLRPFALLRLMLVIEHWFLAFNCVSFFCYTVLNVVRRCRHCPVDRHFSEPRSQQWSAYVAALSSRNFVRVPLAWTFMSVHSSFSKYMYSPQVAYYWKILICSFLTLVFRVGVCCNRNFIGSARRSIPCHHCLLWVKTSPKIGPALHKEINCGMSRKEFVTNVWWVPLQKDNAFRRL